jgi:SAM-dependent methyltransferase
MHVFLPAILYMRGAKVAELGVAHHARARGFSKARLIGHGLRILGAVLRFWRMRNSASACDYDYRAFDAPIPVQRYWQRRRHSIITGFLEHERGRVLDVGCGSSRTLQSMPRGIGLDIQLPKVRFQSRFGKPCVNGSLFALPFADDAFDAAWAREVLSQALPQLEEELGAAGMELRLARGLNPDLDLRLPHGYRDASSIEFTDGRSGS